MSENVPANDKAPDAPVVMSARERTAAAQAEWSQAVDAFNRLRWEEQKVALEVFAEHLSVLSREAGLDDAQIKAYAEASAVRDPRCVAVGEATLGAKKRVEELCVKYFSGSCSWMFD